jgi:hypothetical protein
MQRSSYNNVQEMGDPMRFVVLTAAACSLFACVAFAQEAPVAPAAPAAAAESDAGPGTTAFSASQALHHIDVSGYTRVRKLAKDENGLWQGSAFKGGSLGTVSIEKMGKVNWVKQ